MRKQLNKSDVADLNVLIERSFGVSDFFGKKDRVLDCDENNLRFVLSDDVLFFYRDDKLVPTLKLLLKRPLLKVVVVDMGAVRFVVSGADVMRPGIVELDSSIQEGELVVVVDQSHKKPLCVAVSLLSGQEILALEQGKVLKNIHWVGDGIWKLVP